MKTVYGEAKILPMMGMIMNQSVSVMEVILMMMMMAILMM